MNPYESEKLLGEYLLFHYGAEEEILGTLPGPREALNFAARSVHELLNEGSLSTNAKALDVGCAVGRSSFELGRFCAEVRALDFSRSFIDAARRLQAGGELSYQAAVEGEITISRTARVPAGLPREGIRFEVGDATNLPLDLGSFDVVFAGNLICRLPAPLRFLNRLPDLVKPGGQLLLTTPLTWLEEFTPKQNWLGAREGGPRSFDALQQILAPHFDLQLTRDLPFLIREHERKFQYTVALGTRWLRR